MPVMVMLLTLMAVLAVLLSVTNWVELVEPTLWLPKFRLFVEKVRPVTVPDPFRGTVCGLLAALSVIVRLADLVPGAVGVKVTLMGQLAPAASELPQVFV